MQQRAAGGRGRLPLTCASTRVALPEDGAADRATSTHARSCSSGRTPQQRPMPDKCRRKEEGPETIEAGNLAGVPRTIYNDVSGQHSIPIQSALSREAAGMSVVDSNVMLPSRGRVYFTRPGPRSCL